MKAARALWGAICALGEVRLTNGQLVLAVVGGAVVALIVVACGP